MFLNNLTKYREFGLLLLRLGIGASMVAHGVPKLAGGPVTWGKIGGAMKNVGITFAPQFWGFMAGFAEAGGGVLLALGLLFRPALLLLLIPTIIVAMLMHIKAGDAYSRVSHPLELLILFTCLLLIGPGRFSVDEGLMGKGGK